VIAQTLHGYDQGHRLLARGGDVNEAEFGLLDRLSDLSGYVPLDTTFDAYHTGFPCGRYYAFACTWPDTGATRAGTVLTHTLLVPLDGLDRVHDLWALGRWHRRPSSAADREHYAVALPDDADAGAPPPPVPSAARAIAVVLLWFGQPDRLLWPEARRRFAFCTFALQVRHVRRRPFDFLALPPSARGSFHERARSAAWWREGEVASADLQKRGSEGWAQAILDRGADASWAMARFCEAQGLPPLAESAFPTFHRFADLEEPAQVRLTAARARADLLVRLWPDLAPTHALTRTTLHQLLERQPDAPMSPRPLWDLDDFVGRSVVAQLAAADEGFAAHVADTVTREVRRRLAQAGAEAAEGLRAMLRRDPPHAGFPLDEHILAAARRFDDPMFAADVRFAQDRPLSAIREAATIVAARPLPRPEALAPILARLDPPTRLAWALDVAEAPLAAGAGARGAVAAVVLEVALPEMIARCAPAPNGREVVLSRLALLPTIELRRVLGDAGVAVPAVRAALGEDSSRARAVLEAAVEAMPEDELLGPAVAGMLASADTKAAEHFVERLAPCLVRRLVNGRWPARDAAAWLALVPVREALGRLPPATLFGAHGTRESDPDCLPNVARAAAAQAREDASLTLGWIANLLARPLTGVHRKSLDQAAGDLAALLALPADREGWLVLAARILSAVRRTGLDDALRLVVPAFPVLYGKLVRDELPPAARAALTASSADWDIAQEWRRWLLDAWLRHDWPPAAFLLCLGDDEVLFYRIARRARWKWRGRDFLKSLPGALASDARLSARWRGPVERALGDDDLKLDYD
jgi:hypothetical protein